MLKYHSIKICNKQAQCGKVKNKRSNFFMNNFTGTDLKVGGD